MANGPPLKGIKVIELAGLAPGPFCGQLMSSYGASVLRVDRPGPAGNDVLTSYKSSIVLNLKSPGCIALLRSLLAKVDILLDPFRPGVLEKLGLAPDALLKMNPRLIVLRLTGFRRDGKYKDLAGHDINYLAVSGLLSMLGAKGKPPEPPANVLGDYAGGGLVAFAGLLLALIHRGVSGNGQIVETTMVDGAGYLGTIPRLRSKEAVWNSERGTNLLDGGCPYYRCYECKDSGKYMSVGALEPQFFTNLLRGLAIKPDTIGSTGFQRENKTNWPQMHLDFEAAFKKRTRKEWEAIFDELDACVSPVLEYGEMERDGYEQRPLVHLHASPAQPVENPWHGKTIKPGDGGQRTLHEWFGWTEGKDYTMGKGDVLTGQRDSKL